MIQETDPQSTASRNAETARRVLIVGGVAGGASCAARLRRLDESGEIVLIDRGPYVSFANCGLPYYVGNVISDESSLLVASREMFQERFNIEVHTDTEATSIDRALARLPCAISARATPALSAMMCLSIARRSANPPPAPGRRLARRIRRAHHPGLPPYPFVDYGS